MEIAYHQPFMMIIHELLSTEDTDYLDAGYDVLNFNDFSMGFMSAFRRVLPRRASRGHI